MKDGSISVEQLSIYIVTAICLCHTITHFSNKYQNKFGLQNGSSMDPTIHNRNGDIILVQYTPLILVIKIFFILVYLCHTITHWNKTSKLDCCYERPWSHDWIWSDNKKEESPIWSILQSCEHQRELAGEEPHLLSRMMNIMNKYW